MLSHLPRGRPFIDNYVFPDDMRGWTDIPPGIWALSNDYDAAARPVGIGDSDVAPIIDH